MFLVYALNMNYYLILIFLKVILINLFIYFKIQGIYLLMIPENYFFKKQFLINFF